MTQLHILRHDACWAMEPTFELAELLIAEEPEHLFMSDKRGHAPLKYVRREHWSQWNKFLKSKEGLFQPLARHWRALYCSD